MATLEEAVHELRTHGISSPPVIHHQGKDFSIEEFRIRCTDNGNHGSVLSEDIEDIEIVLRTPKRCLQRTNRRLDILVEEPELHLYGSECHDNDDNDNVDYDTEICVMSPVDGQIEGVSNDDCVVHDSSENCVMFPVNSQNDDVSDDDNVIHYSSETCVMFPVNPVVSRIEDDIQRHAEETSVKQTEGSGITNALNNEIQLTLDKLVNEISHLHGEISSIKSCLQKLPVLTFEQSTDTHDLPVDTYHHHDQTIVRSDTLVTPQNTVHHPVATHSIQYESTRVTHADETLVTQDTEVDNDCTDTVITCPTQEVALTDTELDVRAMVTAASPDTTGTPPQNQTSEATPPRGVEEFHIHSSNQVKLHGSTFQAFCARADTPDDVDNIISIIKDQVPNKLATHNCSAYVLSQGSDQVPTHSCRDDGEVNAGGVLLRLLQS